ncbi:MAG: chromate transporter [Tissierellia bacterium]|nr:chromate transporter [Tissierellia bacterium]
MEKKSKFYWTLFISTFSLSAFTIGGGYVIVPLMKKKFVEELKWIDEEEMLNLVAICQSAPGPIAVNTSLMVGYRLAGITGAMITTFGTVLPPLIIITLIAKFYTAFKENTMVNALLIGMRAGVAAVIIDVIIKMTKDIIKSKNLISLSIMIVAFVAAVILNVNAALIIVLSGAFGGFYYNYFKRAGGSQ